MKRILSALLLSLSLTLIAQEIEVWSSPPVSISTIGVSATDPHIAMDENGNAVALWLEGDALMASTLPQGGSWGTSSTLSASGVSAPQLVIDPAGNATAIWVQSGVINTATMPVGSSWGSATALSASSSSAPQIAVDPTGNLAAIWVTSGAIQTSIQPFGSSWSAETTLSSSGDSPQIAIGSGGTVAAVWHSVNGVTSIDNVNAATRTIAGSWSVASIISDPAEGSAYPQIAVDPLGDALAIWFGFDVSNSVPYDICLMSSTLPVNSAWSSPTVIASAGIRNPVDLMSKVAFTNTGAAIAIWSSSNDGFTFTLTSAQTTDRMNWDGPVIFANDIYAYTADIAVNSLGDVFGAYMAYDTGSNTIAINNIETHVGTVNPDFWSSPVIISATGSNNGFPKIATFVQGSNIFAVVAWVNYNGTNNNIQTSSGTGSVVIPPSNLMVTQSDTDFGVFQQYNNILTWTASTDPHLSYYALFRNDVLFHTLTGTNTYTDLNQDQNGSVIYGVCAVNTDGDASTIVTASFP